MAYKRYLVWTHWGIEGWKVEGQADTWQETTQIYTEASRVAAGSEVLITEYVPLKLVDGRKAQAPEWREYDVLREAQRRAQEEARRKQFEREQWPTRTPPLKSDYVRHTTQLPSPLGESTT